MNRKLLAVLAHPDDESYGIGGTLARYAYEGVETHVVIATDGAAGSIAEDWQGDRARLVEARTQEVTKAAEILGVHLHLLCYRDSGYVGDKANDNPEAFIRADTEEIIGRLTELFHAIQPDVIITHDETGGYFHPDHIRCYEVTTAAFHRIRESVSEGSDNQDTYQPGRLYYSVFSNRWVKIVIWLMRLRGLDPRRAGRNQDIDFTRVGISPEKITTTIDYQSCWEKKGEASAQHASQGGGTSFSRLFPTWLQKRLFATESFVRAYPPVPPGFQEHDLFSEPFP